MRIQISKSVAASLLLCLAGCEAQDPLYRAGLWEPTHINRANLTLQVANPADLVRGTGTTTADGQTAAVAIDRLRNDKVKRLPASDVATIGAGSSGDNNGSSSGTP